MSGEMRPRDQKLALGQDESCAQICNEFEASLGQLAWVYPLSPVRVGGPNIVTADCANQIDSILEKQGADLSGGASRLRSLSPAASSQAHQPKDEDGEVD